MAHSLKQGILGRANGISLRFSPGGSRPRNAAARHSPWCGTWIRTRRGGGKPFSGAAVEDRHGFEDPVGWRRWIARGGRTWFGKKCQQRRDWFHVARGI